MRNRLMALGIALGLIFCFAVSLITSAAAYSPPFPTITARNGWTVTVYSEEYGDFVAFNLPQYTGFDVTTEIYDPDTNLLAFITTSTDGDTQHILYDIVWASPVSEIYVFSNTMSLLPTNDDMAGILAFKCDSNYDYSYEYNYFFMTEKTLGNQFIVDSLFMKFLDSGSWTNYDVYFVPGQNEFSDSAKILVDYGLSVETYRPVSSTQILVLPMDTYGYLDDARDLIQSDWDFSAILSPNDVSQLNPVEWISRLANGILGLELFPGFTIGGVLFAFIFVSVAIALLKLYAGG